MKNQEQMIALTHPEWGSLRDAYGSASGIPPLIEALMAFPPHEGPDSEPYSTLSSSLCHQGRIDTASFAALPHLVEVLASDPSRTHWSVVLLIANIEIDRAGGVGPPIPHELETSNFDALRRVPGLLLAAAQQHWDEARCRVASATLAACKGQPALAECILELEPRVLPDFIKWHFDE